MIKKLFFFLALLLPIGAWADETVIAEEDFNAPYLFTDDGVGASYEMTKDGIAITNPKVQKNEWIPQTKIIKDATLRKGHNYKVVIRAKIPSAGNLRVELGSWSTDNAVVATSKAVKASEDFQEIEFTYNNFPIDARDGHVLFQNGFIVGTCVVQWVKVYDLAEIEPIAERDWTGPYWFGEDGTGATYEMTADGLAITNPAVQAESWTPQTQILQNVKYQQDHFYKVIINAKIPSAGELVIQIGSWNSDYIVKQSKPVSASSEFQDYEFLFNKEFPFFTEDGHLLFQNGFIAGTCIVRSVKVVDLGTALVGEENFVSPYWIGDEGTGATCEMTADGLAITNTKVQKDLWTVQSMVLRNAKLEKGHTYRVLVTAKIPSDGNLRIQLGSWGKGEIHDESMSVKASKDFQDYEFTYYDFPVDADDGHVLFQNGDIVGTCIVQNIQVFDVTKSDPIAEKSWAAPYWFSDEGTGATCTMTKDGLSITNPKVQKEYWTPQTQVLKYVKLQQNHSYKVLVDAKIPSDGELQMQLGSWIEDYINDQSNKVKTSSNFQTIEFYFEDFPVNTEEGHVLFQNGGIAGTCIVRNVRVIDAGDIPVDLKYSYDDKTNTAEVINSSRKYKGDVMIPAKVTHKEKEYTVTGISENAFLDCTTLTSISIPATVTKLYGSSFINCAGLQKITVDPANTVYDSRGNSNAIFHTATNKLSVGCVNTVIPEGTTRIGDDAFWGRWGLEHINIPNTVKEIGMHAFAFCFLKEITLPEGVEKIETEAFWSTDLTSVTLPASLKTLEDGVFMECTQLTKVTVHNQSPLAISDGEIFSNRTLATLYVPAGSKKAYKSASVWKDFKGIVEAENNTIYCYDIDAFLGTPTGMEINLENWDPFTAYQFDLVLPEGFTLEKNTSGTVRCTYGKRYVGSRSISVTPREGNTYRIVSASIKNDAITGNDGALLTVYLVADEKLEKKTYQAQIKNVIMTTPEEKQVNFDPTTVNITTRGLLLGDANDDEAINISDAVATVNYILGKPSNKFNKTAADIDRNHVVDIFDVYRSLGLIKNSSTRAMSRAGSSASDKLTISDFTINVNQSRELQIELTNTTVYAGFQFDLVLPEGITVTNYSINASRIPEQIEVQMVKTENGYRFVGSGLGMETITGNSGGIITITVKADENLKGRHMTGYLREVKLSTSEGEGSTIEENVFNITDDKCGDVDGNGKLNSLDVKAIAELIMKGEYKAKADVNGDNKVDAVDIVIVTNEIK